MDSLFAQEAGAPAASGIPDLVAVRNGTRAEMVRKAVETLGGMQAFVKPGQTVVIKPNIGWNKAPNSAPTHILKPSPRWWSCAGRPERRK